MHLACNYDCYRWIWVFLYTKVKGDRWPSPDCITLWRGLKLLSARRRPQLPRVGYPSYDRTYGVWIEQIHWLQDKARKRDERRCMQQCLIRLKYTSSAKRAVIQLSNTWKTCFRLSWKHKQHNTDSKEKPSRAILERRLSFFTLSENWSNGSDWPWHLRKTPPRRQEHAVFVH